MRVNSRKSFALLKSLRLDRSTFGFSKYIVCLTEQLETMRQSLTFLYRCKNKGIFPNFILHSVRAPRNLSAASGLSKFLFKTRRSLLLLVIRSKHRDIANTLSILEQVKPRMTTDTLQRLQPTLDAAVEDIKQHGRTVLKRKVDRILARQKPVPASNLNGMTKILDAGIETFPNRTANELNESTRKTTTLDADNTLDKVSNLIEDGTISQLALETLAKGPKFAIAPRISRTELQHTIQVEIAALAYAMRWHYTISENATSTNNIPTATGTINISKICPFHNRRKEPPRTHLDTERAIQGLQSSCQRLVERFNPRYIKPNITRKEKEALISLRNQPEITVTRSDKGGEFVIMKTSELDRLCREHLNDRSTYEKLKRNPSNDIRLKINKSVSNILTSRNFPPNLINNLQTPSSARTQRFYALPKTHKKTLKVRPIVSARGGTFDRLGWLLQVILKPLLKHVPANIDNTTALLQRFDNKQLKGQIPISLDVVSLYTNIDTNEAIDTALHYTNKYEIHTFGLQTQDLYTLLHLILDNNVFLYENNYYRQTRGLAMGSRLSGTLAILAMDRFERMFVYKEIEPRLSVYVRFVDDIGTTVRSSNEAQKILTYLNSQHPTIKFELELPDDSGFLPILDTQIRIETDGHITHKLFTKKASKHLFLHYQSHHSTALKKSVVQNEFQRAIQCSSIAHRTEAILTTQTKLRRNGYPTSWTNPEPRKQQHARRKPTHPGTLFTLTIPFISDAFNYSIKHILRKHNIPARLVNKRNTTLRQLTNKLPQQDNTCNSKACPAPSICHHSHIVYQATCTLCKQTYIGQTTRRLHDRAHEHIAAVKHKHRTSALGEHYIEQHPNDDPAISFVILKHCKDVLRLHIEEAIKIQKLRPAMNRKREHLSTGFLP